jgi:RNA polymerase sigma factor (sigma-70 family)
LTQLKNKERNFLLRRFWQQATQLKIADERGISRQAVSRQEARILAKLKKLMEK